ncbi:uncharacterized protein LOC111639138 [Centruroides sculpturatus]|uniref:uncharacterized protein LOC111639138 n=1 Tax=Centruroides sculpturatus TaxID=218467 RepID=UPI000C6ED1B2|nr:uncharacterized protein LOC111639138 [Centruroides sculpturatus]XP_023240694.1 uncharacterized protein LOC111639138 [Centruroides sculpturatus]XP_023240695.1 uncharacterized protein LOC111639138 [Centruroides sculpturatus]
MASSGAKAWSVSQPSAAFVLKCAKEQEKLRVKLQKQLQDHMLQLFEESLFPDVLIAVNDKYFTSNDIENICELTKKEHLSLIKAHKAILKVRVPALYNELCKNEVKVHDNKAFKSFIGKTHLLSLLRKVYTEDDIRKSECEAVRLGKILIELANEQSKTTVNNQLDSSSVKDEGDKGCNNELFVTPTTSPLSPEKKKDIARIFQEHELYSSKTQMEDIKTNNSNKEEKSSVELITEKENNNNAIMFRTGNTKEYEKSVKNFILPLDDQVCQTQDYNVDCNKNSHVANTPATTSSDSPSSGMVRSGTFDLQAQLPLEETLNSESQPWNSQENDTSLNKTSDDENMISEELFHTRKQDAMKSFFLHRNPQLLKGEHFQDSTQNEQVRNMEQESATGTNSPGRRLDASIMSDSGFMSQSTFSLVSEAGLQCSLSSLVTSFDGSSNCSSAQGKRSEDLPNSNKNHKRSSSMFPFYIDIDNLTPEVANPKLPQQPSSQRSQSVYMYIDASKNEDKEEMRKTSLQEEFYQGNFSPFFQEKAYEPVETSNFLYNKLVKVNSFPQLSKTLVKSSNTLTENSETYIKKRPQSCYMFIDLESIDAESEQEDSKSLKKENANKTQSISMFIDLNKDMNESVLSAQQTYSEKVKKEEKFDINDIIDIKKNTSNNLDLLKSSELTDDNDNDYDLQSKKESEESKVKKGTVSCKSLCSNILTNILDSLNTDLFKSDKMHQGKDNKNKLIKENVSNDEKIENKQNKTVSSDKQTNIQKSDSPSKTLKNQTNAEVYVKKECNVTDQGEGLLPMSPILRRKEPKKEPPKPPVQPVVVKASTRPQDVSAMTFRRPESEEESQIKKFQETDEQQSNSRFSSPHKVQKPVGQIKQVTGIETPKVTLETKVSGRSEASSQPKQVSQADLSESVTSSIESSIMSSDKQSVSDVLKERQLLSPPSWSGEIDDDSETIYSEVSDISSSFLGALSNSSGHGKRSKENQSPELESILGGSVSHRKFQACSKLGEDLLKMFTEEIDSDIIVQVQDKEIKAHRCILAARCKYFAAMFKGSWIETVDKIINLQGFTYPAVYFALCHIYSGAINLPPEVNIAEIALLADMLQLDTLKEVIVFHLKMNYCHFFHRPCNQCIQGVVECLHLAISCGLNELYEKCIRWLGKYFTRTWPNKSFAALPEEIREECYQNTLPNLNVNNLIDTILCCDRLITTLSHVKWTEPVYEMVTRLLQDCIFFMALNFDQMLTCDGFLALGKGQSWNVTSLEDSILSAVEILSPDIACKSYVKISEILPAAESENSQESGRWTQNFIDLLHRIQRQCERFLIHNANHVVHCKSWALLTPEVQKRIKDAAVIVFEFEKPTAPPPRLSSLQRKLKKQKDNEEQSGDEKYSTYPRKTKSVRGRKTSRRSNDQTRPRSISHDEQLEREARQNDIIEEDKEKKGGVVKDSQVKISQKPRRSMSTETVVKNITSVGSQKSGRLVCSASEDNMFSSQKRLCQKVPTFERVISDDLSKLKTLEDEDDIFIKCEGIKNSNMERKICMSLNQIDNCNMQVVEMKKNAFGSDSKVNNANCHIERCTDSPEKKVKHVSNFSKQFDRNNQTRYCRDIKTDNMNTHIVKNSQVAKVPPFTVKNDCKSPISHNESYHHTLPCDNKHSIDVLLTPATGTPDSQKDLVAEIDADSSLVSHCLQEAEMLEQELSRKLQRQQQVVTGGTAPTSVTECTSPKLPTSRTRPTGLHKSSIQKPSGVPSRERSQSGGSLRSSPYQNTTSGKCIPKIEHSIKDHKNTSGRPSLPRPISSNRHFRSMESVVSHSRQTLHSTTQSRYLRSTKSKTAVPRKEN